MSENPEHIRIANTVSQASIMASYCQSRIDETGLPETHPRLQLKTSPKSTTWPGSGYRCAQVRRILLSMQHSLKSKASLQMATNPTTMLVRGIPIEDVTREVIFDDAQDTHAWYVDWALCNSPRSKAAILIQGIAAYLNEGWVPDYENPHESKWSIIYDCEDSEFIIHNSNYVIAGLPVLKCAKRGHACKRLMGDDLYTLFNIPKPQ